MGLCSASTAYPSRFFPDESRVDGFSYTARSERDGKMMELWLHCLERSLQSGS